MSSALTRIAPVAYVSAADLMTPAYAKGDRVLTKDHEVGIIRWVYATGKSKMRAQPLYSVLRTGRKKPVIVAESDLRPARALTAGQQPSR